MQLRTSKIDEEELKQYITEIAKGNESALEQFYDEYGRLMFAMIFSIVKSKESSEEILQDVLMAIVSRNPDKPIDNAKAWLFRVIRNISCKRVAEEQAMQTDYLSEEKDIADVKDLESEIEENIDQIESIKLLDETEQQIVIMSVFGDMKLPQVAEILNMPYDKVRNKYNYAVKKLKNYYEERRRSV